MNPDLVPPARDALQREAVAARQFAYGAATAHDRIGHWSCPLDQFVYGDTPLALSLALATRATGLGEALPGLCPLSARRLVGHVASRHLVAPRIEFFYVVKVAAYEPN